MAYLTLTRIDGDPDQLIAGYRRSSPDMDPVGRDHGLILHAGTQTPDGLLIVNLWTDRAGSEAAAADPRRLAVLERESLSPERQRREHHDVERYVVFG